MFKFLALLVVTTSLNAQSFYKTPSGNKYHLSICRMVKNVSEQITIVKARELGLQGCKKCNPQNIYSGGNIHNKAQGQNVTVKCKGLTKKGTPCKHKTSIGNGYCYQHQPN